MTGDGDSSGDTATTLDIADSLLHAVANASRTADTVLLFNDDLFTSMVMAERVEDTVSGLLKPVTEGVVVTLVVVVSHFRSVWWIYCCFDVDALFTVVMVVMVVGTTLKFNVVVWICATAVITLSDVDFFFAARDLNLYLGLCVMAI